MEPVANANPSPAFSINQRGLIVLPSGKKLRVTALKVQGKALSLKNLDAYDEETKKELLMAVAELVSKIGEEHFKDKASYKLSLSGSRLSLSSNEKNLVSEQDLGDERVKQKVVSLAVSYARKEEQRHSFVARTPTPAAKGLIKVGAAVASCLALPVFTINQGLITVYEKAKSAISPGKNLPESLKEAKAEGEKCKFVGLKTVYDQLEVNQAAILQEIRGCFENEKLKLEFAQNKAARYIFRALANHGVVVDRQKIAEIKAKVARLTNADFQNFDNLKNAIIREVPEIDGGILKDKHIESIMRTIFIRDEEIEKFQRIFNELDAAFNEEHESDVTANRLILRLLRELISSPVHKALREDNTIASTNCIDKLSAAIWNDVYALKSYQELGSKILQDHQANPNKFLEVIAEGRKAVKKEFDSDQGLMGKFYYAHKHREHSVASLASEGGTSREVADAIGSGVYDSHANLSNNPFKQGTTSASLIGVDGQPVEVKINNCYGGSPTINGKISPEFRAFCQACENNQFADEPDPKAPSMVLYTNLQRIEGHSGESERSFALMHMSRRYPFSFPKPLTLTKDDPFYIQGKYKGSWNPLSQPKWKVDNARWDGAIAFGIVLKDAYTKDKCFQYGHREAAPKGTSGSGTGIYLHGGKKNWEPVLDAIIAETNRHFTSKNVPVHAQGEEAAKLRAAYQEHVQSLIQDYRDMICLKELYERTGIADVTATRMTPCKEMIDRGGAESQKYLYSRRPQNMTDKEWNEVLIGVGEGRALFARERGFIEGRGLQKNAYFEHFTPNEIETSRMNLYEALKISFAEGGEPVFDLALNPPSGDTIEIDFEVDSESAEGPAKLLVSDDEI